MQPRDVSTPANPPQPARRRLLTLGSRRLLLTALAAITVGAGLTFTPGTASAGVLGGVGYGEANRYCNERFHSRGAYNARPQDAFNAYSWGCFYVNINWSSGVDFNRACTIKYGSPAYAFSNNPRWAWSWMCRR